ncbi:Non-specific serine/threonine protein kinase protein [Dioscorea alata]|uniref:Non-specific serine/threonine protein kinase protein n=1 Tax=Dioscorea alata TaxID=55571 RepID=A0ACB7ULU3_DIOAL|nr:Non-specific serine/threonine protein kinase protein [Dioscorea alata]
MDPSSSSPASSAPPNPHLLPPSSTDPNPLNTPHSIASSSTSPKIGDILLGKYQIDHLLGRGSFAKVYQAHALSDRSNVAIKVLDKAKIVTAGLTERVITEVSAMRRLSHPNIVRLHELMATRSKIYLVMDLAPGGDLFSQIRHHRRSKLSESTARRYFHQLISALLYCHTRGVFHRDIKPHNLLLDADDNLKVADFGLSAIPETLKNGLLHTSCGTPAFTAPEIVRSGGYDGSQSDAWACGVVLFFLLTARLPFEDPSTPLMFIKMNSRCYSFPSSFPPMAKQVINGFLDPNPETRLSIKGVIDTPWFMKRSFSLESQVGSTSSSPLLELKSFDSMNAFDIITRSKSFNLSGLLEDGDRKREQKFSSNETVEVVLERVKEAAAKQGCVLKVEILAVAEKMLMVEVKEEGSVNGYEMISWDKLREDLQDILLFWE